MKKYPLTGVGSLQSCNNMGVEIGSHEFITHSNPKFDSAFTQLECNDKMGSSGSAE